jgi:pimeloyl-ACP methyl ester carboxylesterase
MAALVSPRTRRVIVTFATVALFVVLAGVTFQSVSNAVERRRFPHPGRLVDIGDRQLHLYCVGDGRPVVILEAPAGGMSTGWAWVQRELMTTTRVCAYDRSGLGWSEAGNGRYDPTHVPEQLHVLLQQAGEYPPFVIAGQEMGASFARLYASRYPRDVPALVLIDDPSATLISATTIRNARLWPWFARVGLLRATRSLSRRAAALPATASGATQAFLNRPDHLTRAAQEIEDLNAVASLASIASSDPGVIVLPVTTGETRPPVVLASRDDARTVTRALLAAIQHARHGR